MNRNKLQQARLTKMWSDETGAATAEYAIATMAAVGFAGLLVVIMRSDEVRTILFDLVRSALTFTNPNDSAADPVIP
jgi:Flp pilus assembly pilin Flp